MAKIDTTVDKFGVIIQDLMDDVNQMFHRTVMDTRESHIRRMLISLGWTPPPKPEVSYYLYYWIQQAGDGDYQYHRVEKGRPYHFKIAFTDKHKPIGLLDVE